MKAFKFAIYLSILLLSTSVSAQNNQLTKEQMLEDFQYYVDLLEKTHVDPYTPIGGKVAFKVRVKEFENRITKLPNSVSDFSLLLTEFISFLKDNHTNFSIHNNTGGSKIKKMPFLFGSTTDELFIRAVKEPFAELYGAKLLSVNDIETHQLLKEVLKFRSSENKSNTTHNLGAALVSQNTANLLLSDSGYRYTFRFVTLEQDTIEREIKMFPQSELSRMKWHTMHRNKIVNSSGIFSYEFIDREEKIMYYRVDEMFSQEVVQMMKAYKAKHGNWVKQMYRYYPNIEEKYGEKAHEYFPYFSESFYNMLLEMKKKKSDFLILDLSRNGGGYSEMAIPAMYMLAGDNFFNNQSDEKRVTRVSELYLNKYSISIDDYSKQQARKYKIGDYNTSGFFAKQRDENKKEKYFKRLKKNKFGWLKFIQDLDGEPIYSPKIVVLTSENTNSAAFHFLTYLYKHLDIKVVGVAPMQAGNTPMENTPFHLPNSKINGSISNSYQYLYSLDDPKAKLFLPDFPVTWKEIQEKDAGRFSILEIALDLIRNGKIQ